MNLSGTEGCGERNIDSPFTALSDVPHQLQYPIEESNSQHTTKECPPTPSPQIQMCTRPDNDEQTNFLRIPQPDILNCCDSVPPLQSQTPGYTLPCEYQRSPSEHLWHRQLRNDDLVRLSSLLPPSLLTSAFPAHLLLTGRSYLESPSAPSRNPPLLPPAVHSKDQAFSSDGSSLSLDGYHKSKYFKDSTSQVTDSTDDAAWESDDDNRIDVCNVKESGERECVSPSSIQDQDTQKYEEDSEDDTNSLTSLSQLVGQCSRTVPGLLKYYSRHKMSLSSSLTVSLSVTDQSTPPSSPISPGTFQRPIVSSAPLNERTITVNSTDESKSKSKRSDSGLSSPVVPLLTVPKRPLSSASFASSSSLENVSCHRPASQARTPNKRMIEKSGKSRLTTKSKHSNMPEASKTDSKLSNACDKLATPNVVANIADIDTTYRHGMPIGMENLASHYPHAASTYHPEDISRHTALLLSQGIDPNIAGRIGLGYQFVRDPVTGHIILLPNSHHLPSTNPSLLWAGFGGVAASPLVMAPQQLLLNDPHYRQSLHPHLLHVPQHPLQLNKSDSPQLKCGPQSSTLSKEMTLPILPSELPSANIPPHFLYPSTTLPCYLTGAGQPLLPLSNFNTQLDNFKLAMSSAPSENGCTVTTNSKLRSPIVVTTASGYTSTPSVVGSAKKPLKELPHPAPNKFPVGDSAMEPPMDLTKKKKSNLDITQREMNIFGPISINTDTETLSDIPNKSVAVKREIKQELMSTSQVICSTKRRASLEDVAPKEECFSDVFEHISNLPLKNCPQEPAETSENGVEMVQYSHSYVPTVATSDNGCDTLRGSFDKFEDSIDVSGLKLLSHSIQQHEDNHQLSAPNSDEEFSCIEMPRLERINFSPSPRHSPVSCELPPVLTPVEINGTSSYKGVEDCTILDDSNSRPQMPTKYSGLNLLCVLAEQELSEKNNNCSALSSLAEVAAAHQSIKEPDDMSDWSLSQQVPPEKCDDLKLTETPSKDNISSEARSRTESIKEEPWFSSIDINRNYKNNWQANTNIDWILDQPKAKTSLISDKMNGREIKFRLQLAELQRKYKKKKQKLTKLHKKKFMKKDHSKLTQPLLEQVSEEDCKQSNDDTKQSDINTDNHHSVVVGNKPQDNTIPPPKDDINKVVIPSATVGCEGNEPRDAKPLANLFPEEVCSIETSISDNDQHWASSKRKPGRPKKHSLGSDELFNSKQNFDFMMVSHKPKILPKLRAELKVREHDQMDEGSDFGNDDSDDNLPLSAFQKKGHRKRQKQHSFCKVKKVRTLKKRSFSRRAIIRDNESLKKSTENQSNMEELFRSLKRHSKMAAEVHDESDDDRSLLDIPTVAAIAASPTSEDAFDGFTAPSATCEEPSIMEITFSPPNFNREEHGDLLAIVDGIDTCSCKLKLEDLVDTARVLVAEKGLLYAGSLLPLTPPDIYRVNIDGERNTRPRIYCRDELLSHVWKEIKPGSKRFLKEGTRICAFWSQQYRALYTGVIAAASSPSADEDHNLVNVEFDDGDQGRIHIDDVRLLPQDFPLAKPDPNPIAILGKRKRSVNAGSTSQHQNDESSSVSRYSSTETAPSYQMTCPGHNSSGPSTSQGPEPPTDAKREDKKAHRRHSSKHKHKHKHRHKEKSDANQFPRVEPVDGELRVRITSPSLMHPNNKGKDHRRAAHRGTSNRGSNSAEVELPKAKCAQQKDNKKHRNSTESKITPFLPEGRLWRWASVGRRRGKARKTFHSKICRGNEQISTGDCAVFLSTGKPERPYIGKIELLWESNRGKMEVKVKWFYHPDETEGLEQEIKPKKALFESDHTDRNDVQTISRICYVLSLAEFYAMRFKLLLRRQADTYDDVYYLAGSYDPGRKKVILIPRSDDEVQQVEKIPTLQEQLNAAQELNAEDQPNTQEELHE